MPVERAGSPTVKKVEEDARHELVFKACGGPRNDFRLPSAEVGELAKDFRRADWIGSETTKPRGRPRRVTSSDGRSFGCMIMVREPRASMID